MNLTRDQRDCIVREGPQRTEHRTERGQTALEASWRADAEERPHPEPEIEGARMHEQPLEHVLVSANVCAAETTGPVQMRTWPFEQFAALSKEAFPAVAADATSIRIDRVAFRF